MVCTGGNRYSADLAIGILESVGKEVFRKGPGNHAPVILKKVAGLFRPVQMGGLVQVTGENAQTADMGTELHRL